MHEMTLNDEIIVDLGSPDPRVQNKAAIRLIDCNAVDAIPSLTQAITAFNNIDANGTLVYALGHFECSPHFELLVSVALRHQFEASWTAHDILKEHEFELRNTQLEETRRFIESLDIDGLTNFQQDALATIIEKFFEG